MNTKQTRTEAELKVLLMDEVRRYPECDHITSVAITRPPDHNWDVAWGCNGPKAAPAIAYEIARRLAGQFDLA
jgi:hypothetical protein